jgi:hypothetical protein
VISSFRHEVAENSALLDHYAASSGNFLPTFRDILSVPSSGAKNPKAFGYFTPEDESDSLPRNVSKKLPLLAA